MTTLELAQAAFVKCYWGKGAADGEEVPPNPYAPTTEAIMSWTGVLKAPAEIRAPLEAAERTAETELEAATRVHDEISARVDAPRREYATRAETLTNVKSHYDARKTLPEKRRKEIRTELLHAEDEATIAKEALEEPARELEAAVRVRDAAEVRLLDVRSDLVRADVEHDEHRWQRYFERTESEITWRAHQKLHDACAEEACASVGLSRERVLREAGLGAPLPAPPPTIKRTHVLIRQTGPLQKYEGWFTDEQIECLKSIGLHLIPGALVFANANLDQRGQHVVGTPEGQPFVSPDQHARAQLMGQAIGKTAGAAR